MKSKSDKVVEEGGYGWVCVIAGFFVRFLLSGQQRSFGILLTPLMDAFSSTAALTVWINGITYAVSFAMSPVSSALVHRFDHSYLICLGGVLAGGGLALSYFDVSLWFMFLTYGFLFGFGCGLTFNPVISIIPLYFKLRLSFALGLIAMGSIAGGAAFPFIVEYLYHEFSYTGALLISGAIVFNVCALGLLIKQPKTSLHDGQHQNHAAINKAENLGVDKEIKKEKQVKFHWEIFRDKRFILYMMLTFSGMGYFQIYSLLPVKSEESEEIIVSGAASVSALALGDVGTRLLWAFLWDISVFRHSGVRELLIASLSILVGISIICIGLSTTDTGLISAVLVTGVLLSAVASLYLPVLAHIVGPLKFGNALGAVLFFEAILMLILPVVAGYLLDVTGTVSSSLYLLGSMFATGCPVSLLLFFFDRGQQDSSKTIQELHHNTTSSAQLTDNITLEADEPEVHYITNF